MELLHDYMRTDYLEDKGESERVASLIRRVAPVFERFFIANEDETKWPYKVIDRRRPNAKEEAKWEENAPYSHSPNAMILFTLFVVSGRVRSHVLVPRIRPLFEIGYSKHFEFMLQRGFDTLRKKVAQANFETHSVTFGENDPFTLTWILELAHSLHSKSEQPTQHEYKSREVQDLIDRLANIAAERIRDAARNPGGRLLHFRIPAASGRGKTLWETPEHVFPLLRIIHLYKLLEQMGKEPAIDLTSIHRYFTDRLHSHLSYSSIPNRKFDAAELAFSLEGALICNPDTFDEEILKRAFQVIAERQAQNPYWTPMRPFVATPQGLILLPLSVELANSLLRICALIDGDDLPESYFSAHVNVFKRYAGWVFSRLLHGEAHPFGSEIQAYERFIGWHSEHIDLPGTIHLWETSQVLLFLFNYGAMLQQHVARSALYRANFSGKPPDRRGPKKGYWDTIKKRNESVKGFTESSDYRIYDRIGEHYVAPRARDAAKECVARERHYSMLLYGPPGTGKTTVAQEMARALGYRFIEITPSDFIARGEAEVEARAKAIFQTLREQSEVVILFDEIDRMILDRDSKLYQRQSDIFQFMTPGMLTKIKDLRDQEQPIFVIATNYIERIDRAAKRSGRMDDLYLVLPPDRIKRYEILRDRINEYTGTNRHPERGQFPEEQLKTALEEPLNNTALLIPKELDHLVRNALRITGQPNGQEWLTKFGKELTRQIDNIKLTITLTSYGSRFRSLADQEEEFLTVEEPFEEFLLLVGLVIDVKDDLPHETKGCLEKVVLGKEAKPASEQSLLTGVLGHVRDDAVKSSLLKKFKQWGWCK